MESELSRRSPLADHCSCIMSVRRYHFHKQSPFSWHSEGAHSLINLFASLCANLRASLSSALILFFLFSFPGKSPTKFSIISILSTELHLTFYKIFNKLTIEHIILRQTGPSRHEQVRRKPSSSRSADSFLWTIRGINFWSDGNRVLSSMACTSKTEECTHFFPYVLILHQSINWMIMKPQPSLW